jgi:phage baseplate assembly protein W
MSECITQPFQYSENDDLKVADKTDLIQSRLEQLLMTRASGEGQFGELMFNPNMGSLLHLLKHQRLPTVHLKDLAIYYIRTAVSKYMPELTIVSVEISTTKISGSIALNINIKWQYNNLKGELGLENV